MSVYTSQYISHVTYKYNTLLTCLQAMLHHFSAPDAGYMEPFYDDHDALDKWQPDWRSGQDAIDGVTLFVHLAAQKLADRALNSAIEGAVADVIQVRRSTYSEHQIFSTSALPGPDLFI